MTVSRLLSFVNPLARPLAREEREVRSLRASSLAVALLVVPFGWLFHASDASVADPMAIRWAIKAAAVALVVASFRSRRIARHARVLTLGATYTMVVYLAAVAWANGFAAPYPVGMLFLFVAVGLAQSLTFEASAPYGRFLLTTGAIILAVPFASGASMNVAGVFVLSTVMLGLLQFLIVSACYRLLVDLAENESHLAEAQGAAGMGSWQKDLRTGDVRWSAGMYALTGLDPVTTAPSAEAFVALAHPDDAAALTEHSTGDGTMSVRYRRPGTPGWRHAEVRRTFVYAPSGEALRVFGTIRDTTEQTEREAALHEALRTAEAAAATQSAFLANMSHEIRTPLTAILGYAELLAEETDDAQRDLVQPIADAGERLLATLNSVLDFARMEAGETHLAAVPVDLAAEARAVGAMLAQRARAKGLTMTVDAPGAPLVVLADAAAVHRVLANLVSNAVKFTHEGGVTVRAACEGGEAVLSVRDTGHGMTPAFLEQLFEPFRQASTGWARSHEGTGLGLAIVRRLVEGMGGTVAVRSRLHAGTCFTVRLPLASPAARHAPAADDDSSVTRPALTAPAPVAV